MTSERQHKSTLVYTEEYLAGILAGIGLGMMLAKLWFVLTSSAAARGFLVIMAFACIAIGSTWVRSIQERRLQKDAAEKGK